MAELMRAAGGMREVFEHGSGPGCSDAAVKSAVHEALLHAADVAELDPRALEDRIAALCVSIDPVMGSVRCRRLTAAVLDEVQGLGPIEPLLADPEVTEIMLNGGRRAFVERAGAIEEIDLGLDASRVAHLAQRVVAPLGLRLDRSSPMVEARLPDGSRFHAAIPPVSPDGPCITIRRFARRSADLADFDVGAVAVHFLTDAVRRGWNILVSGATTAGKTTLLGALAALVPAGERIVTIEETLELSLGQANLVRLEARPANAEGTGAVTTRALVRAALRMRPDRIVVGEVRGGEALDMLQAMSTGHDGSLSTVHANSARDALDRLETLVLLAGVGIAHEAVRQRVGQAIDAVVHVGRGPDGRRRITEVVEVDATSDARARCRVLFARVDDVLVPVGAPRRAGRRHPGASETSRRARSAR